MAKKKKAAHLSKVGRSYVQLIPAQPITKCWFRWGYKKKKKKRKPWRSAHVKPRVLSENERKRKLFRFFTLISYALSFFFALDSGLCDILLCVCVWRWKSAWCSRAQRHIGGRTCAVAVCAILEWGRERELRQVSEALPGRHRKSRDLILNAEKSRRCSGDGRNSRACAEHFILKPSTGALGFQPR